MPLPLIIGIGVAIVGAVNTGAGIAGIKKTCDVKDKMRRAQSINGSNIYELKSEQESVTSAMDSLRKLELKILGSLKEWTEIIKDTKHLPKHALTDTTAHIPPLNIEKVTKVSVGVITVS